MDEKLFVKIIDEFIDTDEERGIDFSSNNEPLLDDRIIDFIEYTRKQLGKRTNCKCFGYFKINKSFSS
ncbi:MAG: hypothetical protein M1576_01150 [Deltaproteobacteria bacterium]|nr:hypothetical protein [Deltaproteobacteria bacterium]